MLIHLLLVLQWLMKVDQSIRMTSGAIYNYPNTSIKYEIKHMIYKYFT